MGFLIDACNQTYIGGYQASKSSPSRPVGRVLKLGWPIKCLFPPKVGVAHCTFYLKSAKSWGGSGHPGHPSTYGPVQPGYLLLAHVRKTKHEWVRQHSMFYDSQTRQINQVLPTNIQNSQYILFAFFHFMKYLPM